VASKPDLLVILAGDGTAALAGRLAGPDGPVLVPLPGGTMNMLPHALYGAIPWRDALHAALSKGVVRSISGGEIGGRPFYVAAILGAPALWADAREAVRARRLKMAFVKARKALARAFAHKLHFTLGDGVADKAEALTLMCPLVSRGVVKDGALEAAALDPRGAGEVLRLGFNAVTGDWRADPSVTTTLTKGGMAWARGRIPAVLDGEPCRLEHRVTFAYFADAFRALAPAPAEGADAALLRQIVVQAPAAPAI
jgi:diacylglycerol kinase family enzyme